MAEKCLRVYLQMDRELHPVSRKLLTTARTLGKGYFTQGVVLTEKVEDPAALVKSGLDQILLYEGSAFGQFDELQQGKLLGGLEPCEIFLFPATPEGRGLAATVGALLHTGVTADCTELQLREDGSLLQIRPAFSGQRLAGILTRGRPQIASLRFGIPVPEPEGETEIRRIPLDVPLSYKAFCQDRTGTLEKACPLAVAVGGGLARQEDLAVFEALAEKLGAGLYCSRALVDRGWMGRDRQIGLSGCSLDARKLICFGISGSLQFGAGLGNIGTLIAVNQDPEAPILKMADLPIRGEMLEIAGAMLKL